MSLCVCVRACAAAEKRGVGWSEMLPFMLPPVVCMIIHHHSPHFGWPTLHLFTPAFPSSFPERLSSLSFTFLTAHLRLQFDSCVERQHTIQWMQRTLAWRASPGRVGVVSMARWQVKEGGSGYLDLVIWVGLEPSLRCLQINFNWIVVGETHNGRLKISYNDNF